MKIRRYGVAGMMALCMVAGALLAYSYRVLSPAPVGDEPEPGAGDFFAARAKTNAHLYFFDNKARSLRAEERAVEKHDDVIGRARTLIRELIEGPKGDLVQTIPADTKLLALYVNDQGTAYVDFDRAVRDKHPGGVLCETFTIFSIVNTLVLNIPEIEAVKIIVDGGEAETLAGHVDIRSPFRANLLLIK